MQLEVCSILHLKLVEFFSHKFGTTGSFAIVFHTRYLDSGILVFIFMYTLVYQMVTVGMFYFLNRVIYIDNWYLVIVNVVCCSFQQ
jgi:hypothetical protein